MDITVILIFLAFIFALIGAVTIPRIKDRGLWAVALFSVNMIEQITEFLELQGYGLKKYEFVKGLLLKLNPELTDVEIDIIIETLVREMNALKNK